MRITSTSTTQQSSLCILAHAIIAQCLRAFKRNRTLTIQPIRHSPIPNNFHEGTTSRSICSRCNRQIDPTCTSGAPYFCSCDPAPSGISVTPTSPPTLGLFHHTPSSSSAFQAFRTVPSATFTTSMLLHNGNPEANSAAAVNNNLEATAMTSSGNKRVRTDNYHDHSNDPIAQDYSPSTSGTFPFILHTLLDEVHDINLSNIVSWRPHGRAFMVHHPNAFVEHVMKLYFKQTQMTSFVRQLNIYGFKRLHTGRDAGGYYHEYFLRDRIDLCSHIKRMKLKGGSAANLPMREPNFYEMVPVGVCKEARGGTDKSSDDSSQAVSSTSDSGTSSNRDAASTVSSSSDEKKGSSIRKNSEASISSNEGRSSVVVPATIRRDSTTTTLDPSSSATTRRVSSTVDSSTDLMPRPLPPLFDTESVGSVQFPGTWRTMEIGNERWVFHLTASRSSSSTIGSSSRNDVDSNESSATATSNGVVIGDASTQRMVPFQGVYGLEQQAAESPSQQEGLVAQDSPTNGTTESEETDPILQLTETLLAEDPED